MVPSPSIDWSGPWMWRRCCLLGIAKADGEITSDQKRELQNLFQNEFEISRDEAADLLLASSYLIRDEIYIVDHLDKILELSAAKFEPTAVTSLLGMMRRIAALDGSINGEQQKLIDATEGYFATKQKVAGGKWS